MLGEGMVSFGVAPSAAVPRRNVNASSKIVCCSVSGATTWAEGGAHS